MKKILVILLLQMAIAFNVFAQGEGDRIVNPFWKLSSGALTPTVSTWTLTLPATAFSPSIVTPLIIGGADTISTLTYKTTTGVGKTGARHIFLVGNNGATEAMTILNNGFMGIGTTSPSYTLDVSSDIRADNIIYANSSMRTPNYINNANSNVTLGFAFDWASSPKTLSLLGWGADGSVADVLGGDIYIKSGKSSGTGTSNLHLFIL